MSKKKEEQFFENYKEFLEEYEKNKLDIIKAFCEACNLNFPLEKNFDNMKLAFNELVERMCLAEHCLHTGMQWHLYQDLRTSMLNNLRNK